ncbi:MAG: polyprenyl synthetase family protein [Planctomycetaceae bacterium]|jgi:octaprenyl-diphosphate synthase|nr:polyprenyl synthetase family protein [Planctomycetaceae bacterium]
MNPNAYRLIEDDIAAMKALSQRTVADVSPGVEEIVRYSLQFSGKCLRPALLFLTGKIFGTLTEKHLLAAAAIEFVHTATLIHDDILDGASLRRHLDTINVRWNAQVGVLAGDLLLSKSLELMAKSADLYGIQRLTEACNLTCEGELRQMTAVGCFEMTMEQYLQIIGGKTASLLACSAELGAYYSGAGTETVEKFRLFGHKTGIAFQMIDDILDLVGETKNAGKTLRTDLMNGKPTLPVILYLQSVAEPQRQTMLEMLRREEVEPELIVRQLTLSGVVEEARKRAQQEIDEALALIADVEGDAEMKSAIKEIAFFVTKRNR